MAQIVINEISQNYTYNIGTHSYATVALPITSCWGPGYFDPESYYPDEVSDSEGNKVQHMLDHTVWQRFPATQAGLESFVATYRGPASNYRMMKDFSYQMAMTLLTAGYDVLVCRMCPGRPATGHLFQTPVNYDGHATKPHIKIRAKYPGTFGNNLQIAVRKMSYFDRTAPKSEGYQRFYWNFITYVIDATGMKTSVENRSVVFNPENATDTIPYYAEADSNFWEITEVSGTIEENKAANEINHLGHAYVTLGDNSDVSQGYQGEVAVEGADYSNLPALAYRHEDKFRPLIQKRYDWAANYVSDIESDITSDYTAYATAVNQFVRGDSTQDPPVEPSVPSERLNALYNREWLLTHAVGLHLFNDDGEEIGGVYDLLKDKLAYNPNRVISPGWDDQDYFMYEDDLAALTNFIGSKSDTTCKIPISPLHLKLMDVAYHSRCATGFIDVPRVLDKKFVHIEDPVNVDRRGYIQKLARVVPKNASLDTNGTLFHTHCAFFAPWGQYQYVGTGKMNIASPSFLTLLIQRAQILNQPTQYEWALPTNRRHNLKIGKMDYTVPKKVLDKWQKLDGASVNVITNIPDLGVNLWGNSTLYEVPPVTYQALANLSTRYLVNAVEDCAYKCGISITFQYNNDQAYNKFYAGVTPLLDTMKNVGAIEDYYVKMSADINGLDHVNANTVIGKIYLVVNGVINDIIVDLIALPPSVDLDQFRS